VELQPLVETREVRTDEESQRLAALSTSTVDYMYEYGLAREGWLRHHRGNLLFLADREHDLLEAMRLSGRLNNVVRSISRTGRRNEAIRAELVKRELAKR
jgi:hypothetical protein